MIRRRKLSLSGRVTLASCFCFSSSQSAYLLFDERILLRLMITANSCVEGIHFFPRWKEVVFVVIKFYNFYHRWSFFGYTFGQYRFYGRRSSAEVGFCALIFIQLLVYLFRQFGMVCVF